MHGKMRKDTDGGTTGTEYESYEPYDFVRFESRARQYSRCVTGNGSEETKSMVLNLYEGSRNKSTTLVVSSQEQAQTSQPK